MDGYTCEPNRIEYNMAYVVHVEYGQVPDVPVDKTQKFIY
jgi:hypothetical protein